MNQEKDNVIHAEERFGRRQKVSNLVARHILTFPSFPTHIEEREAPPAYIEAIQPIIALLERQRLEEDAHEIAADCARKAKEGDNEASILKYAERALQKVSKELYRHYITSTHLKR